MKYTQNVYKAVSQIPKGKVATYKTISNLTGIHPRLVGNILHKNKDPENIPCHRVVSSRGKAAANYAFGGESTQVEMLKKEGVVFLNGKVDLKKYRWRLDSKL